LHGNPPLFFGGILFKSRFVGARAGHQETKTEWKSW
jgi:hypothetical protein